MWAALQECNAAIGRPEMSWCLPVLGLACNRGRTDELACDSDVSSLCVGLRELCMLGRLRA